MTDEQVQQLAAAVVMATAKALPTVEARRAYCDALWTAARVQHDRGDTKLNTALLDLHRLAVDSAGFRWDGQS